MVYKDKLQGKGIYLRSITKEDCNFNYVNWLNDPLINKYLESRFEKHTENSVKDFVECILLSEDNYFFAICSKDTNKHIGNIKIGPINNHNKNAYIGYLIGDKSCWGRGYGTQAIKLVVDFGFNVLALNKVKAGVICGNEGSSCALKKAGFTLEGTFKKEVFLDDTYVDTQTYGILRKDYLA